MELNIKQFSQSTIYEVDNGEYKIIIEIINIDGKEYDKIYYNGTPQDIAEKIKDEFLKQKNEYN